MQCEIIALTTSTCGSVLLQKLTGRPPPAFRLKLVASSFTCIFWAYVKRRFGSMEVIDRGSECSWTRTHQTTDSQTAARNYDILMY